MKKVILDRDAKTAFVSDIKRNSHIGSCGDRCKSIVVENFDNTYLPVNITAGFNSWHPSRTQQTKKKMVEFLLDMGADVYVFDSVQELLEWAAK